MNRTGITVSLLTIMSFPTLVLAQSTGFTIDGQIALNYSVDDSGSDATALLGTVDANYDFANLGPGVLGFELDANIYMPLDTGSNLNRYYGGLTYSGAFGKVTLGKPRSAFEQSNFQNGFNPQLSPTTAGLNLFFGSYIGMTETIVDAKYCGLSYEGTVAGATVAASYHTGDTTTVPLESVALAVGYNFGPVTATLGYDSIKIAASTYSTTRLTLEGEYGPLGYGLSLAQGDNPLVIGTQLNIGRLYAAYDLTDALRVELDYSKTSTAASSGSIYGLQATYAVTDHFGVGLDVTRSDESGGYTEGAVSIVYTF